MMCITKRNVNLPQRLIDCLKLINRVGSLRWCFGCQWPACSWETDLRSCRPACWQFGGIGSEDCNAGFNEHLPLVGRSLRVVTDSQSLPLTYIRHRPKYVCVCKFIATDEVNVLIMVVCLTPRTLTYRDIISVHRFMWFLAALLQTRRSRIHTSPSSQLGQSRGTFDANLVTKVDVLRV